MTQKAQTIAALPTIKKSAEQITLEAESILKQKREDQKKAREAWLATLGNAQVKHLGNICKDIEEGKREPSVPTTVKHYPNGKGKDKPVSHYILKKGTAAFRKVEKAVKTRQTYLASKGGTKDCMAIVSNATLTSFVVKRKGKKGSASARWAL